MKDPTEIIERYVAGDDDVCCFRVANMVDTAVLIATASSEAFVISTFSNIEERRRAAGT